ncbi:winged helix-turn-helix domain-containing protein [Aureimonas leprariae]|uniref:Winged helix-turn-helix domain-containing protein n=1 Tax=Plantimonas leprariae TaxID=2615207 RepID=A0A7V7PR44_9HYPH|nr:crosslink repair DNA glycosylase YcaQ family protein [Aureimonas leprariae]KAB0680946.1 winged helix-turn-helix domain-containing protein [Aureimonas leprariae]
MSRRSPLPVSKHDARRIWLRAQRLDSREPFGGGAEATPAAVRHLGYVQIDTINVIERSHHHILWTRIPSYRLEHLAQAQSVDRSVFEYWTHALSFVPAEDYRFFLPAMRRYRLKPANWFEKVTKADLAKVMKLVRDGGALSIREIDDDVLVEKDHAWASRKPSKRALQLAFYTGALTISARTGMLKTYELTDRHFGWAERPKPATERQVADYMLDRALKAQGIVSLDSVCHLVPSRKTAIRERIEARVRRGALRAVAVEDAGRVEHWAAPEALEALAPPDEEPVHLLSPFDPLIIQRKRLAAFFGYEHRFEAYVPSDKRVLGYFALPVLVGDRVVAAFDLKTDRRNGRLLMQKATWLEEPSAELKRRVDAELGRFERFQLQP